MSTSIVDLELFRRAVIDNDTLAWQSLFQQYGRLVVKWGAGSDLKADDLVHQVFARFWRGVQGRDFPFLTIQAALGYLRSCARTLVIDAARQRRHQETIQQALQALPPHEPGDESLARILAGELRAYIQSRLRDEDERIVFRLSYELGFSPLEICTRHPERFADARAVYRVKARLIARLSNDPGLARWKDD